MNKNIQKEMTEFLANGKTVEDCVTMMTMIHGYKTKSEARGELTSMMESEGLTPVKKASKSQGLKDWFLSLDNPLDASSEDIKKKCEELEMKGGSVQYYINSYKLAIDLFGQIK